MHVETRNLVIYLSDSYHKVVDAEPYLPVHETNKPYSLSSTPPPSTTPRVRTTPNSAFVRKMVKIAFSHQKHMSGGALQANIEKLQVFQRHFLKLYIQINLS